MPSFPGVPLDEALSRALTGRSAGFADRLAGRSLPDQVGWLEKVAGGVGRAARAAGVSASTWRRWKTGQTRKATPEKLAGLHRAQREAMIPGGRRDRISKSTKGGAGLSPTRPVSTGATLTAVVRVSDDIRTRTLHLGAHLSPGRLDAVVNAYLSGGTGAARAELDRCIAEYMGTGAGSVNIGPVDGLTFT